MVPSYTPITRILHARTIVSLSDNSPVVVGGHGFRERQFLAPVQTFIPKTQTFFKKKVDGHDSQESKPFTVERR